MDFITGGSGFLGRHLREALGKVVCIPHDRIASSNPKECDNFYFLSTYGNIASHTDENKIIQANVIDLITVLKKIDWNRLHSFVYVSTSSVKRKVQTVYSRTKKAAEEILLAYAEKYNAPITIVRPLTIAGVGDNEEHLIPTLIRSALTGKEMPFVPDACHDYINVWDVAAGILTLSKRRARGIFELGTGISRSNQEVRELVEKITGKKIKTHIVSNLRAYDTTEWVSDNFRARQYGWKPEITFEKTIEDMVNHYERK